MDAKDQENSSELFKELIKKVKPEDIDRVLKKIGSMNKGALVEIWDKVVQLWNMVKDPSAEWGSKAIALGALLYTVSPVDAIPDIIPVLGLTDDAGVIALAITTLGTALVKYANKNQADGEIKSISDKGNISETEEVLRQKLEVIVSILNHASYADNELSEVEELKCSEIIDYMIFSDEGFYNQSVLEGLNLTKRDIKKIITSTFENPLPLSKISELSEKYEIEEEVYLYAYTIANADMDINEDEQEFLSLIAKKLELSRFDTNNIERNFNHDWLLIKES